MQLEIEEQALKKERDKASQDRLGALRKEISDLKERGDAMRAQWTAEKEAIRALQARREEAEQVRRELEIAERNYDLTKAAELRHGRLPDLEKRLQEEEKRIGEAGEGGRLLREEVTEDEIAEIVSRWTGVPVSRLMEGEREKLLHLDEALHQRVIGQDEAVQLVADAVIRARAGIKDPRRPIGSFIFLGPTGVGKTELARALAQSLFDSEESMVRIDMSEYMEKHTVSRLVGAPPGYVGYDEGGQLTEAVRRHPYCVVLFDEFEKAHHDVWNVLLQILDEGRLTDAQGRTVDFKNTLLILTSNLGSHHLLAGVTPEGALTENARARVMEELEAHCRPEFLNRIDEVVFFAPLTLDEIGRIVDIQVALLRDRLKDQEIGIGVSAEAREAIARAGYDPVYGARPLKRYIQRQIETKIGRALLSGGYAPGSTVEVAVKDGELTIS
jgi:ATP-dependent Clp protease ATP-binding subunit ClpB